MKFEFKKVIGHKLIWICFIVLMVLCIYTGIHYAQVKYDASFDASYRIKYQQEMYNNISEYRSTVVKNARRLAKSENEYVSALNNKLLDVYSKSIELSAYDSRAMESVLENGGGIGMVLCIFICCIFALKVFFVDTDNVMQGMIMSSPKGKGYIYKNKWICILLVDITLVIIVFAVRLIPLLIYGSLSDILQPIQSIEVYSKSPYNISILEYYIMTLVMSCIEIIVISAICVIVINLFKDIVIPIVISVLLSAASMAITLWIILKVVVETDVVNSSSVIVTTILRYTPIFYINNTKAYFASAQYLDMFGYPISILNVSMVTNILTSIVLILIGFILYIRRQKMSV